jgi:hypothetical protein
MTLYDRVAATPGGARRLADARLRHAVLSCLHRAKTASNLTPDQLAAVLGVRRRVVRRVLNGNGDIGTGTLARYLHAMGYEAEIRLVAAGEPRQAVVERRETRGLPGQSGYLVAPGDWPAGQPSLSAEEAEKVLDGLDRLDGGDW